MKAAIEFAERAYTEAPILAGVKATSATNVALEDRLKFLEMLAKARDTAGDSVYRQRISMMLDELPEPDDLRKTVARLAEMGDPRKDAPTVAGRPTDSKKFLRSYALVDIETGKAVGTKTRFKVRWDDEGAVIFEIKCDEPDMKNLFVTDDVWTGDSIAIQLETQGHAYYQIEVNPDGKIFDADRHGRLNQRWKSNATVETERGARFLERRRSHPRRRCRRRSRRPESPRRRREARHGQPLVYERRPLPCPPVRQNLLVFSAHRQAQLSRARTLREDGNRIETG